MPFVLGTPVTRELTFSNAQLERILRSDIESGVYRAGDLLPSVVEAVDGRLPIIAGITVRVRGHSWPAITEMSAAMPPIHASVVAALRLFGGLNAGTPFEMASTPDSTTAPDENARMSAKNVT